MDKYVLKLSDIRNHETIEITEARYHELVESEELIRVSAQIEEKIDLLLDNYIDYEREILSLSLSNLIRSSFSDDHVERARPNLNRKLVNILTAARLYVDQTCAELSSGYGKDSEIFKKWNDFRQQEHKASLSYQFMEVLRNYVQHRSLPINTIGFRGEPDKRETPIQYRKTVYVKSNVESLLEFSDFRKSKNRLLLEKVAIKDNKKEISLGFHISEYVDCLCRLHNEFRSLSKDSVTRSEQFIVAARNEAEKIYGNTKLNGLIAVQLTEGVQVPGTRCRLNGRRMKRRRALSKNNLCAGDLSTSYVHSMSRSEDK